MGYEPQGLLEHILIRYRWVFVCFFLLPASFFYDGWMRLRNWIVFRLNSAPHQHASKVERVQKQVLEWMESGRRTRMCTARPGWQTVSFRRPAYKGSLHQVAVNLVDILEIDFERKVLRAEPMVTMGQLTATLNPLGWTIPVLPEIDDLTIGGLVMGTGIESTSHKHGLFQHICVSYEVVLCDGSVLKCSRDANPDLFYSVPWSYGTLGFLTAVEIRMVPAKRFVRLKYEPVRGCGGMAAALEKASADPRNEFVEGIMFSEAQGVIMTGNLTDTPEQHKVNPIGNWYKPWFFVHVRNMLGRGSAVECIPLRDYYHRHTRSIFWELQDIIPFGNNAVFRYLLGWIVPPKISLLKLTQTEAVKRLYESCHVIQDMLVPMSAMGTCLRAIHDTLEVYPLWLCPFVLPPDPGMVKPKSERAEMYVDIGIYGTPAAQDFEPRESTRTIESLVMESNGFQMLYADTYTTRQEFRRMFDHSLYDRLRAQMRCDDAFPEVYDKVSKESRA